MDYIKLKRPLRDTIQAIPFRLLDPPSKALIPRGSVQF